MASTSTPRHGIHTLACAIASALTIAVGAYFLTSWFAAERVREAAQSWPTVDGTITACDWDSPGGVPSAPVEIRVAYVVDDVTHETTRVSPGGNRVPAYYAQWARMHWLPGSAIPLIVDPTDPSRAFLVPGWGGSFRWTNCVVGSGSCLIGIAGIVGVILNYRLYRAVRRRE